jgi:hypothetical protein
MNSGSSAGHEGDNDVRLTFVLSHIVDGDDIGVVAELSHGTGFADDARPGGFVYLFGLDEGEGDVTV